MQDKDKCCNQDCNQGRACPVRAGTHKPAEALHQIQEPAVNQHFTKDAAEAFIKRKKHDYRDGLRVYVNASSYSWELNTIKAAILSGQIGLLPLPAAPA